MGMVTGADCWYVELVRPAITRWLSASQLALVPLTPIGATDTFGRTPPGLENGAVFR